MTRPTPLYRLENILQRHEVQIARSTMCGWMAQCAALLQPLHELMIQEVRASKVIHTDDTPVEVKEAKDRPAAQRQALRQERSPVLLAQFSEWLQAQQAAQGGPILPKSPIGQAITYALNQWRALNVYVTDGDLAIDNNASENALRRVALGRKNWLFCGSDNGGRTAAVLFSLIATCQRHKVEPLNYFRNLLTQIAGHPATRLAELLPIASVTPATAAAT